MADTPARVVAHAIVIASLAVVAPLAADAQQAATTEPHLPPGPSSVLGSPDLIATSSAGTNGSYLWIVGPREHVVMLCEKKETEKDFTCTSKRLP